MGRVALRRGKVRRGRSRGFKDRFGDAPNGRKGTADGDGDDLGDDVVYVAARDLYGASHAIAVVTPRDTRKRVREETPCSAA